MQDLKRIAMRLNGLWKSLTNIIYISEGYV